MWSTLQDEGRSKSSLLPDVLRVERNFMGVVAPDVTENEKIGSETRADGIKHDEFNRENTGTSDD